MSHAQSRHLALHNPTNSELYHNCSLARQRNLSTRHLWTLNGLTLTQGQGHSEK